MVDVLTSIEIRCPIGKVSHYATNPDNAPLWYKNIHKVEWKTAPPVRRGSQIAFVATFVGKKLAYTYEVVEMNEHRFVMRTVQGPFPMETTYEWEAIDEHATKMSLRNRGNLTGFLGLFAPFMSMMMRRANNKDLRMIKSILERQS